MDSILIVSGENSGEKYGADLVREFKKINNSYSFFGIGGKYMSDEGVEILFPVEDLAVVGVAEIISHLPRIRKIFNKIKKETMIRKPAASILIDFPDFNIRLAKKLRKLSVPVLYYISPTVWAWRKGRLKTIRKTVNKMLLIFPFEEEIYRSHGIPADYIGHPLIGKVKVTLSRDRFFKKYGLDHKKKLITLLPGSRKSELKYHMPVLVRAVQMIKTKIPCQFMLILADNIEKDFVSNFIPHGLENLKILTTDSYNALASSDLALSSCGTANLECALLETPFISFYRLSPLTYYSGVIFIKIHTYSIVNILAGKKIVPEFIQRHFSPENICNETIKIIGSEKIRAEMISQFQKLENILGCRKASLNAAKELNKIIKNRAT